MTCFNCKKKVIIRQAVPSSDKTSCQKTNNPPREWLELYATLELVPCIWYPVRVRKAWEKTRRVTMAIIGSKVTITKTVPMTRTVRMAKTVTIAMTSLPLPDKLGKVWFFEKTFCWLTLAWFFTFNSTDIRFARRELVWMIYTAADNQIGRTFWCKRISGGPWGTMIKVFVAWSWRPRLFLLLAKFHCLARSWRGYDPRRVFRLPQCLPSDSVAELPTQIGINNNSINLVCFLDCRATHLNAQNKHIDGLIN